jgi:DNA-binding Xre family transcriptional regulator
MIGVPQLTAALKLALKAKQMTYAELGRRLGLSESSVKRLFSTGSFALKRLEEICRVLELDFYDLAQIAGGRGNEREWRLTLAQEQALAANPKLLLVFHLLLNDRSPDQIVKDYAVSRRESVRLVAQLQRLSLLDAGPHGAIELRTSRNIAWRENGPVRRAYQNQILKQFFEHPFEGSGELLRFEGKELSAASADVLLRKLKRLVTECNELAETDGALKSGERSSFGLLVAFRPYVHALFARLKQTRR